MATKNVKLNDTDYNGVDKVKLPLSADTSSYAEFVETSDANAAASDISQGKTAYVNGTKITGTNSGGGGEATLIEKTITANGTYNATDDSADGYSKVTVNVPSSGSGMKRITTTSTGSTNIVINEDLSNAKFMILSFKCQSKETQKSGYVTYSGIGMVNFSFLTQSMLDGATDTTISGGQSYTHTDAKNVYANPSNLYYFNAAAMASNFFFTVVSHTAEKTEIKAGVNLDDTLVYDVIVDYAE